MSLSDAGGQVIIIASYRGRGLGHVSVKGFSFLVREWDTLYLYVEFSGYILHVRSLGKKSSW